MDVNGVCYLAGTPTGIPPGLPSDTGAGELIPPWPTVGPMPPSGCTSWPCSEAVSSLGRSINSLADVAQYYYVTDLRPDLVNDVFSVGGGLEDDKATHQHMTTFAIALGVSGTLNFDPAYKTKASGDFEDLRTGTKIWPVWPDPGKATWNDTTKTFFPAIGWEDPRAIDDFWHTAVNGRGQFFSAANSKSMEDGLKNAFAGIDSRLGSGTSNASSSRTPVAGDNFGFFASHTSMKWTGDVVAKELDLTTSQYKATTMWSAAGKLAGNVGADCDNRTIYVMRGSAAMGLFTLDTKRCDASGLPTGSAATGLSTAEQASFNTDTNVGSLAQFLATGGGSTAQLAAAKGANLVNFLRGQSGKEGFIADDVSKLFRARDGRLGDIVNSNPVYVKGPFAQYVDPGYMEFVDDNKNRTPMLYVGANDGMLHAFKATVYQDAFATPLVLDAEAGKELWAVIPSVVLKNMYLLADNEYKSKHRYFVDGSPVVGDIDIDAPAIPALPATRPAWTAAWRTILVGGLNNGGQAYYALDVTDPATPKAIWEFKPGCTANDDSACELGKSYGQPLITKLEDGRWVVILTSGYNNPDGKGHLYVLAAYTGDLLYDIVTSAGGTGNASGLAQINAFINDARFDNTAKRVYGGDVLGNIWLFDINKTQAASLLGTTKTVSDVVQPITVRPELAEFSGRTWLYVGTGRLLGESDLNPDLATTTQTQSIYGFIDFVTSPDTDVPIAAPVSNLHDTLKPLLVTYDASNGRQSTPQICDKGTDPNTGQWKKCNGDYGWVLDLPDSGERLMVEMKVLGSTLVAASNVYQGSICNSLGYSWLNFLDAVNGGVANPYDSVFGQTISQKFDAAISGLSVSNSRTYDPNTGEVVGIKPPSLTVNTADGQVKTIGVPISGVKPLGRRVSWKELINK